MNKKTLFALTFCFGFCFLLDAQVTTKSLDNVEISTTTAKYLGKSQEIRHLIKRSSTSKEKKDAVRRQKKVPDNFKNRRAGGNAVNLDLEHQGVDPIRQTGFNHGENLTRRSRMPLEPLVNIDGITSGSSPNDPTGDVSAEYYLQAINVTDVGVFDLEGNLIEEFAMNTLWAEFNGFSVGDPIILYDENAEKWVITEFSDPANLFVAISATSDPLGAYSAYSFSTPNFPDYPKYAITPSALVVTTNEGGPGTLHQYFMDIDALYAGGSDVRMLRVALDGNNSTEAGFYVTTPIDWNGANMPFDNRPMVMRINDSSWQGGPDQDQVEIYAFDLDFDNPQNTTVEQTAIVTTPFDSYPCSQSGFGFHCVPQLNGGGLDAIPEVIMNIPHLRNFGTHESLVFNFVTDVTDGDNLSGIRWVELRRTAETDWELYQEGTFSLDDGLDRYMGSIAIDANGNIGLAYNVSSLNSYVGVRFTGRYASDPLGQMTLEETIAVEGESAINSFGRFGDYSQMSVTPNGDNTFWFTTEYGGSNVVETRIVAFQLSRDTFDLSARAITSPTTTHLLGTDEIVRVDYFNTGLTDLTDFEIGFFVNDLLIESTIIPDTLHIGATLSHSFSTPVDLSTLGDYSIKAYINHPQDTNLLNDTITTVITKLNAIDGELSGSAVPGNCAFEIPVKLNLSNLGGEEITTAIIDVIVNGMTIEQINYGGSISFGGSDAISYVVSSNLMVGENNLEFRITDINGTTDDITTNNTINFSIQIPDPKEFITLVFNTDDYSEETSWEISENSSGAIIASGSYEEEQENSMISEQICLSLDSCYSLTVFDEYGDGICCGFGEGNFSIFNGSGQLLIFNDGDFGTEVTEEFCPSEIGCMVTATFTTQDASNSSAFDGSLMIMASGGIAPYQYSIDGGITLQDSEVFENLAAGPYEVVVNSGDGVCAYTETVTIDFSSGIHIINGQNVEVDILPNPTEGVFKVIISNLNIDNPLLHVEVFDNSGRLIQNRTIGKFNNEYIGSLSLYDYPDGSYFIKISNKDFNVLEKIVKSN